MAEHQQSVAGTFKEEVEAGMEGGDSFQYSITVATSAAIRRIEDRLVALETVVEKIETHGARPAPSET